MNDLIARVEQGNLLWESPALATAVINSFEGKRILLNPEEYKNTRSYRQNRYYWKEVIGTLYDEFMRRGINRIPVPVMVKGEWITKDQPTTGNRIHEMMKALFDTESTAKLSTVKFMEYVANIQQYGAEEWGVYIPDPNEEAFA